MTDASSYFDLSPTDRSMAILDRTSSVTFHVVWDMVGPVDLDALLWAWRALARLHPILACTTDLDTSAVWQPGVEPSAIDVIDGEIDVDGATAQATAAPLEIASGPIVRLTAIKGTAGLRLVLAAQHAAFDGAASVVMIEDLRRIYLGRLSGDSTPVEPDFSPRTVRSALQQTRLPMATAQGFITQSLDRWRKLPPSGHVDPAGTPTEIATGYVTIDVGPALGALDQKRRRNSWPTDAVLVGLLETAWSETLGAADGAGIWLVAANLRPGLGLDRGSGNLSGVEPIAMRNDHPQSIDASIEQAAARIAATKAGFPGLGPELMARSWAWTTPSLMNQGVDTMIRSGRRQRYTRILSNMGKLPDSLTDWGPARLEGLRYLGPMAQGPYCMFVAQAHGGNSWLTVRTSPDWFSVDHAKEFERAINRYCGVDQDRLVPAQVVSSDR